MLKRVELIAKGFGPRLSRNIYLTFMRPMFEYCFHLVRIEQETLQEVLRLETAFFTAATGMYKALLPWFHKLFKLEDFKARRIRQRDKMRNRTTECDRVDNPVLETALTLANNTEPSQCTETTWNEADQHKIRRSPIPNGKLYPAFYLKKHVHRVFCMEWFLHRFPAKPHLVRETMGALGDIALERLQRVLPQAIWSKQDTTEVIAAIDAILEQLPS